MALIVEDGSGLEGAESYIPVSFADEYHQKMGNTAWTGENSLKEAALRRATRYMDGFYSSRWKGWAAWEKQALDWPRENVYSKNRYYIPANTIPLALQQAQAEAALRELVSPNSLSPELERGGEVQTESVTAGPTSVTTTYAAGASVRTKYTVIDGLLRELIGSGKVSRLVRS